MKKKALAVLILLAMIISMLSTAAFASEFADMPSDWSTTALENAVSNGLLIGDNGKIMPNGNLTRAQIAAVVNRAFGTTEKASLISYTDVAVDAWYFDDMSKAVQMKTFVGSGDQLNPDMNITREEAFLVFARAFKLSGAAETALDKFSDKDLVSQWAKDGAASLVSAGYVIGSNGQLNPKQNITRAEFAQIFYNILKQYVNKAGVVTEVINGNIMINTPGVTLKNLKVNGDLIIGDGVGNGEVILDSVEVTGRMVVRGGGVNSIIIRGNSEVSTVVVARIDGKVSVKVQGDANVEVIYIDDESNDVNVEGAVGNIQVAAPDIVVTAVAATIKSVDISGENSKVIVDTNSTVETVSIKKDADKAQIEVLGTVSTVTTAATGTTVTGTGTVTTVEAQSGATGASIETPNTQISVGAGVTGVTGGGGNAIQSGSTAINNTSGTDVVTPTSPSTGGGGASTVAVSAINVTGTGSAITITTDNGTLQMLAAVKPTNATDKSATWAVTNGTGSATINGTGLLTAVTDGTVTVIATSVSTGTVTGAEVLTISNQIPTATVVLTQTTRTIVYTFIEPVQLVRVNDSTVVAASAVTADMFGIYGLTGSTLAENKVTPIASAAFDGTGKILTIVYTGVLPAGSYVIAGFEYDITDLSGNKFIDSVDTVFTVGAAVTGLTGVLQLGETITATAGTTEAGAGLWTSSTPAVASVNESDGLVAALTAGTTTIFYRYSTSGNLNSQVITIYAAATVEDPKIGLVQVGAADVTPTDFTAAGAGETIAWASSDTARATVDETTGVIHAVAAGDTTISCSVVDTATGAVVVKGSLAITVNNASQTAPTGVAGVAATIIVDESTVKLGASYGKITGVNASMEYKLKSSDTWIAIPEGTTEITGLVVGTYEVRYAAKQGSLAGNIIYVVVKANIEYSIIGGVAADSILVVDIDLKITRQNGGDAESYSQGDEFDNSGSGSELAVNKTYYFNDIVSENPEDTATIKFYYSYRG